MYTSRTIPARKQNMQVNKGNIHMVKNQQELADSSIIDYISLAVKDNYDIVNSLVLDRALELIQNNQNNIQLIPLICCKWISLSLYKNRSIKQIQNSLKQSLSKLQASCLQILKKKNQQNKVQQKYKYLIQCNGNRSDILDKQQFKSLCSFVIMLERFKRYIKKAHQGLKIIINKLKNSQNVSFKFIIQPDNQGISIFRLIAKILPQIKYHLWIQKILKDLLKQDVDRSLVNVTHIIVDQLKSSFQYALKMANINTTYIRLKDIDWITLQLSFQNLKYLVQAIQTFQLICKQQYFQIFQIRDIQNGKEIGIKINKVNCLVKFGIKSSDAIKQTLNYISSIRSSSLGCFTNLILQKNKINQHSIIKYLQQINIKLKNSKVSNINTSGIQQFLQQLKIVDIVNDQLINYIPKNDPMGHLKFAYTFGHRKVISQGINNKSIIESNGQHTQRKKSKRESVVTTIKGFHQKMQYSFFDSPNQKKNKPQLSLHLPERDILQNSNATSGYSSMRVMNNNNAILNYSQQNILTTRNTKIQQNQIFKFVQQFLVTQQDLLKKYKQKEGLIDNKLSQQLLQNLHNYKEKLNNSRAIMSHDVSQNSIIDQSFNVLPEVQNKLQSNSSINLHEQQVIRQQNSNLLQRISILQNQMKQEENKKNKQLKEIEIKYKNIIKLKQQQNQLRLIQITKIKNNLQDNLSNKQKQIIQKCNIVQELQNKNVMKNNELINKERVINSLQLKLRQQQRINKQLIQKQKKNKQQYLLQLEWQKQNNIKIAKQIQLIQNKKIQVLQKQKQQIAKLLQLTNTQLKKIQQRHTQISFNLNNSKQQQQQIKVNQNFSHILPNFEQIPQQKQNIQQNILQTQQIIQVQPQKNEQTQQTQQTQQTLQTQLTQQQQLQQISYKQKNAILQKKYLIAKVLFCIVILQAFTLSLITRILQ